jgi:hypothetical protein
VILSAIRVKAAVKVIKEDTQERRKNYFLDHFKLAASKSSNVNDYQFWRHDNHPIELSNSKMTFQKIGYIHYNPVNANMVEKPENYLYSSAIDYSGGIGLLTGVIVVKG